MIQAPLRIKLGNKFFALNLNVYRNTHYQILNKAKILYKEQIKEQLIGLVLNSPVTIIYTYYPKDKRLSDLGNVLTVQSKFFEDALVEYGYLPDDNYLIINQTIYKFGGVDKNNPRVEIIIKNNSNI